MLKLVETDESISIIEQVIQCNKSKQTAELSNKLLNVAGQTSRSVVVTTQCAKASSATGEDEMQYISSLSSWRQIDLGLSEIECKNTNDAIERSRALWNLLSHPLNISKKLFNNEQQLIKRYDLYFHLPAPNFNLIQADLEYRLASHNKTILIILHIVKYAGESIITALEESFS